MLDPKKNNDNISSFNYFNDAPVGIIVLKKYRVVNINDSALTMINFERDEIIGKTPAYFSPKYQINGKPSKALAIEKIDICLEKGLIEFDWLHKSKNGENILMRIMLKKDANSKDVSIAYWKRIDDEKKYLNRFNTLINNYPGVFYILNDELRIEFLSDGAKSILGENNFDKISFGKTLPSELFNEKTFNEFNVRNNDLLKGRKDKDSIIMDLSHLSNQDSIYQDTGFSFTSYDGKKYIGGFAVEITELMNMINEIKEQKDSFVQLATRMTEIRDPYTTSHEYKVAQISEILANRLNLDEKRIEKLKIAARIHDIGKLGVPLDILSKPGKLSDLEYQLIQHHVIIGYNVLSQTKIDHDITRIVLEHHERIDGTGYPNKLVGDEILFESQILSVSDAVEAMSSHRPYRPRRSKEYILNELKAMKGKLLSSEIIEIMEELVNNDSLDEIING